jgi:hypothetical protein
VLGGARATGTSPWYGYVNERNIDSDGDHSDQARFPIPLSPSLPPTTLASIRPIMFASRSTMSLLRASATARAAAVSRATPDFSSPSRAELIGPDAGPIERVCLCGRRFWFECVYSASKLDEHFTLRQTHLLLQICP